MKKLIVIFLILLNACVMNPLQIGEQDSRVVNSLKTTNNILKNLNNPPNHYKESMNGKVSLVPQASRLHLGIWLLNQKYYHTLRTKKV